MVVAIAVVILPVRVRADLQVGSRGLKETLKCFDLPEDSLKIFCTHSTSRNPKAFRTCCSDKVRKMQEAGKYMSLQ